MTRNPLRDLLNRIAYDSTFDASRCTVEYRDYEAAGGTAKVKLAFCRIDAKNLHHGDGIIPFHRITRVVYENKILYPFEKETFAGEG